MTQEKVKFRLKGHESFQIREGWLRKGIKGIQKDIGIFSSETATDELGVGTNMVKSIRFWLQATGLAQEKIIRGSRRGQELTKDFGEIINKFDPYFEDIVTLWLIHYKLATNKKLSTSWYLFFNEFSLDEFNKEQMLEGLSLSLKRLTNNSTFSEKTLSDDCDCIIKTYQIDRNIERNPEENTVCPLTGLGLIDILPNSKTQIYIKKRPNMDRLDRLVIFYIILDNLRNYKSTSIDKILNDNCNVGKILNIDRNMLNEYLDMLKNEGYIEINRTAGLDKVYIKKDLATEEVMRCYYEQL